MDAFMISSPSLSATKSSWSMQSADGPGQCMQYSSQARLVVLVSRLGACYHGTVSGCPPDHQWFPHVSSVPTWVASNMSLTVAHGLADIG